MIEYVIFFPTLWDDPHDEFAARRFFCASGLRQAARQRHRVGGGAEADCADAGGWAADGRVGPLDLGNLRNPLGMNCWNLWILQIPWDFEWEIRLAGYGEVFPVDFPMNQGEIGPGRNKSRDFSRCLQTFQQIFLWIFMIEPVRRGVNPPWFAEETIDMWIETAMEL